jgi:hypothetical protein
VAAQGDQGVENDGPAEGGGLGHRNQLAAATNEAAGAQKSAWGSGWATVETHIPGRDAAIVGGVSEEELIGAAAAAGGATPVQNGKGAAPSGASGTGKTKLRGDPIAKVDGANSGV